MCALGPMGRHVCVEAGSGAWQAGWASFVREEGQLLVYVGSMETLAVIWERTRAHHVGLSSLIA
jgi:hypothetical protein